MVTVKNLFARLDRGAKNRWPRQIDLALLYFLYDEVPDMDAAVMLAIVLVSHRLGQGQISLDLALLSENPEEALSISPETARFVVSLIGELSLADWITKLKAAEKLVDSVGLLTEKTPLVLIGSTLYLRRYWKKSQNLKHLIALRLKNRENYDTLPDATFSACLSRLFPADNRENQPPNWQKIACVIAAKSAFSIITGGPGTGKTTTVSRLLLLFQSLASCSTTKKPLRLSLAAPTGKAAARLKESLEKAFSTFLLAEENAASKIQTPHHVSTLHQLLGSRLHSREFRYNAHNPLPVDILIIDESSMIDLEMMTAVLDALPLYARLILLGDKDQLSSVEAGSVFGGLCKRAEGLHFLPTTAKWLESISGEKIPEIFQDKEGNALDQHIVMLRESRRFDEKSGIGQLARAVNKGDALTVKRLFQEGKFPDIFHHDITDIKDPKFTEILFRPKQNDDNPPCLSTYLHLILKERPTDNSEESFDQFAKKVLKNHGRFQLLSALREGNYGVEGINRHIENLLEKQGQIKKQGVWYEGRPVLMTKNDYALNLMNGDIGITFAYPEKNTPLRVAFMKNDGSGDILWVSPSRLSTAETAFALTIHKAQGSEFEHCALLFPPQMSPILTRELLYTAITRAKNYFSLICTGEEKLIEETILRTIPRSECLSLEIPSS